MLNFGFFQKSVDFSTQSCHFEPFEKRQKIRNYVANAQECACKSYKIAV